MYAWSLVRKGFKRGAAQPPAKLPRSLVSCLVSELPCSQLAVSNFIPVTNVKDGKDGWFSNLINAARSTNFVFGLVIFYKVEAMILCSENGITILDWIINTRKRSIFSHKHSDVRIQRCREIQADKFQGFHSTMDTVLSPVTYYEEWRLWLHLCIYSWLLVAWYLVCRDDSNLGLCILGYSHKSLEMPVFRLVSKLLGDQRDISQSFLSWNWSRDDKAGERRYDSIVKYT